MKNKFTRILSGLMCALIVVSMLASCADNTDDQKTVVDPSKKTEEKNDTPTFVEQDFDGQTFTILSEQDEATDFIDHYIDNEEQNGDPINDAVIERNNIVEEKYNVDIKRESKGISYASQASKSGTVDFEAVYNWGFRLVPSAMEGIFYDFNSLPVIDLEQSYWAPSTQEELTIAGKMMITTCDITMNRIAWAYFFFFNKNLMDQRNLEYPYTYVQNNEWTFDKFLSIVIGAETENGDTIWDEQDIYGCSGLGIGGLVEFAGLTGLTKNDDGTYALDTMNEKIQLIYSNYKNTFDTSNTFCHVKFEQWLKSVDVSAFESPYKASRWAEFGEEHVMFAHFSMDMTNEFNNMEANSYGVVPNPKYDSAQEEYYHYIDKCAPMLAIPKQADLEFMGTILEYLAYESQQILLPAYYDQTVKVKRMDDIQDRDSAMLDIVKDSTHYSTTGLYYQGIKNVEGDGWDPIGTIMTEMLAAGQFASANKRYASAAEKSLSDFYDEVLALDLDK